MLSGGGYVAVWRSVNQMAQRGRVCQRYTAGSR
jgi:hypothetical protein